MNIDQALDILRKCCTEIDIDDNGHERECGKCEVCRAIKKLSDEREAMYILGQERLKQHMRLVLGLEPLGERTQ